MDAQEQGRLTIDANQEGRAASFSASPTDALRAVAEELAPTDGAGVIANAFYTSEYHGGYELISIGALDLEEGGHIPDCRLAVTTRPATTRS
jgi:hypothetical protein